MSPSPPSRNPWPVSSIGAFHCARQFAGGRYFWARWIEEEGQFSSWAAVTYDIRTGYGKFALRALSQCQAKEFQPLGMHVAHVVMDGIVGAHRKPSTLQQLRSSVGEQQQSCGDVNRSSSLQPKIHLSSIGATIADQCFCISCWGAYIDESDPWIDHHGNWKTKLALRYGNWKEKTKDLRSSKGHRGHICKRKVLHLVMGSGRDDKVFILVNPQGRI
ncbi:hypothetical protein F0562_004426 [Nyssa sinensis]|uniref:Uncharacterized protein n=1 Tax=Nyssa sinensis TaxID=561372 RepID=A0A5J5C270_9ASTE|nr:hypothetical protein F0562_004426 [Nyssa sinensis]